MLRAKVHPSARSSTGYLEGACACLVCTALVPLPNIYDDIRNCDGGVVCGASDAIVNTTAACMGAHSFQHCSSELRRRPCYWRQLAVLANCTVLVLITYRMLPHASRTLTWIICTGSSIVIVRRKSARLDARVESVCRPPIRTVDECRAAVAAHDSDDSRSRLADVSVP